MSTQFNSFAKDGAKNPKSLDYTPKPFAFAAAQTDCMIYPVGNQSYTNCGSSTKISFNIPCGVGNALLDPKTTFLRFMLEFTTAAGATPTVSAVTAGNLGPAGTFQVPWGWVQGGGHGCIKQVVLSYNNQQLENIYNYNDFTALCMLNNLGCDSLSSKHSFSGLSHNQSYEVGVMGISLPYTTVITTANATTGAANAGTNLVYRVEVSVPLNSSLIGVNAERMLPLMLTSNYTLDIYLADIGEFLYCPTAQTLSSFVSFGETPPRDTATVVGNLLTAYVPTAGGVLTPPTRYNVNNIALHYSLIELSPSALAVVRGYAAQNGGILLPSIGVFSNIENQITSATSSWSKTFDIQYSSLKSLFATFHSTTKATTAPYLASFLEPSLNYYVWRVGNKNASQNFIGSEIYYNSLSASTSTIQQTRSLMKMELDKAFGNMQNVNDSNSYSYTQFVNQSTAAVGAFAIGCPLDITQEGSLICGVNTMSQQTMLSLNCYANINNMNVNIYGLYDQFIFIPYINDFLGTVQVLY